MKSETVLAAKKDLEADMKDEEGSDYSMISDVADTDELKVPVGWTLEEYIEMKALGPMKKMTN